MLSQFSQRVNQLIMDIFWCINVVIMKLIRGGNIHQDKLGWW